MKRRKELPGLNMTPMIDVVFQMIIFFICTSELEKQSVDEKVALEWARDAHVTEKQNPLTVTINIREDGAIRISGSSLKMTTLKGVLENTVARHGRSVPVVIRGDLNVRHRSIQDVLDLCKGVGIWKISFAAIKSES